MNASLFYFCCGSVLVHGFYMDFMACATSQSCLQCFISCASHCVIFKLTVKSPVLLFVFCSVVVMILTHSHRPSQSFISVSTGTCINRKSTTVCVYTENCPIRICLTLMNGKFRGRFLKSAIVSIRGIFNVKINIEFTIVVTRHFSNFRLDFVNRECLVILRGCTLEVSLYLQH